MRAFNKLVILSLIALLLAGCSTASVPPSDNGKLNVIASTTLVGDVAKNIGGDHINLDVLIPPNVDEHAYEPTPQDAAKISRASLILINGAGLEQFMDKLMRNAGPDAALVSVSEGIPLLEGPAHEDDGAASPLTGDPHVWMDPNNVLTWVDNIEKALIAQDPPNAAEYQKNAASYRQQLTDLDAWVREQVDQVPQEKRALVTDHLVFTYFASRYGFEQVGAIVPGYSTLSSPSAQELAGLEDSIRKLGVPVIFVGNTVNPALSERVAADTNTKLVPILTGSLTDAKGPAPEYLKYIRYNVTAITSALKD